ncbi:Probable aspartic protease At2g35615 [Linum perenne]
MSPTIAFTIITFFLLYSINSLTHSHGFKITTRLIHRDSIHSPLYNASLTTEDRAKRAVRSSLARHAYLSTLSSKDTPSGIEAGLVVATEYYLFYVNFSIGQPPVPQLAVMDTGSEMLWVKCLPCFPCSPISGVTLFDPLKSKTYFPRPCTRNCMKCTEGETDCMYRMYYMGGFFSEGVYSTEQLTFGTSDDGLVTIPDVHFGCSSMVIGTGKLDYMVNGIFGLGGGENPLITKLGSKFSYCVGSASDHTYLYNHLTIGDESNLLGESTPFYTERRGDYFVRLTSIRLGGRILGIGDEVFKKMSKEGITVDSGTNIMMLHSEAFEVVKAEVKKFAPSFLIEAPLREEFELCYKGTVNAEGREFPIMELRFAGEAVIEIDNRGMFIQADNNTFCFAVIRSPNLSIIGIMAQQGYNVGYDLKASRIYFQGLDCQILEARES